MRNPARTQRFYLQRRRTWRALLPRSGPRGLLSDPQKPWRHAVNVRGPHADWRDVLHGRRPLLRAVQQNAPYGEHDANTEDGEKGLMGHLRSLRTRTRAHQMA